MRIVHMADTHLGIRQLNRSYKDGRNIREQDFYSAFSAAIDRAIELEPACVIHAGDLFDSYHPSSAALATALDGIGRLIEAGIPTVIIAGNHSTPRVTSAQHIFGVLRRFDRSGLVHAVYSEAKIVRVDGLAVHAIPHFNDRETFAAALHEAQPSADADFNIAVVHTGFDALHGVGASEPGTVTLSGKELEAVRDFDYIALGHLHQYDRVRTNAVYSGSLERVTWADDARRPKGIVEVDLTLDVFDDEWHKLHEIPSRPYIHLDAIDALTVDDLTTTLLEAAENRDDLNEAMVRVRVNNLSLSAQAGLDRQRIEQAFAGCLHFDIDARLVGERGAVTAPQDMREFLSSRVPAGMDPGDFIARAERYLNEVMQEAPV